MPNPPKLSKEVFEFEYNRIRELVRPHFSDIFAGYSIPRGWMYLVEKLHREVVAVHPNYRVEQIANLKGSLRFYVEQDSAYADLENVLSAIIATYEDESEITCADCGSTSGVTEEQKGWVFTVCGVCFKSRGRKFVGSKHLM